MRISAPLTLASMLLAALWPSGARAQSAPDSPVGLDFFGKPLVVTKLTASDVGGLAAAAGVPMGFEAAAPGGARDWRVEATGRPLRAVLDAIVAADPRYEWRDENGVTVIRPAAAWTDRDNALHRSVGQIRFDDVGADDALRIVAGLFGTDLLPSQRDDLRSMKRFNVDLPPGTLLDALNGLVRAHGALAWGLEPHVPGPLAPGSVPSPYMIFLVSGGTGRALGSGIRLDRPPRIPELVEQWRRPADRPAGPVLDRIVGRKFNGDPLVLDGAHRLVDLAYAARVPIGLELIPGPPPRSGGTTVTGLSVRDALAALILLDPRYEWREFDGVIVVRPVAAWGAPEHPLSREVPAVRLDRVTVDDAVDYLAPLLEPRRKYESERYRGVEVPRLSVNVPAGTLMALLNAMARAQGELCWLYEELNDRDTEFFGGRRHQVSLRLSPGFGGGVPFR